jgi:hypothetical protein
MALWDIPEISPDAVRSALQSTCANLGVRIACCLPACLLVILQRAVPPNEWLDN